MYQVTYSILSADALMAEVAQAYAMDAPVSCQLLRRGLHDTYLLTMRDSRSIARIYRAWWRTPSDVAYELELLIHLTTQGVSVAVPIPTRDGYLSRARWPRRRAPGAWSSSWARRSNASAFR